MEPINLKQKDKIAMGVIGAVILAAVAIPVLTYLATITALLATVIANTTYFLIMLGAIIFGGMALWDSRLTILYAWKNFARNMARAVVRENPVGTYDTAISRLNAKLEDVSVQLAKANGAYKLQAGNIKEFRSKAADSDNMARAAQKMNKDSEAARFSRQAVKWDEAADSLEPVAENLKQLCGKMQQAREAAYDSLETIKGDREVFAARYNAAIAGQKAVNSFKRFFGSNPDLDMLNMSIDEIERQSAEAEANIDQFLVDIKPIVEAGQIKDAAQTQKALDRLNGSKLLTEGIQIGSTTVKEGVLVGKA